MAKLELIETQAEDLLDIIQPKSKFMDRIRRGDVCDIVVDTETTSLSKEHAHPTALAGVVADPFTRTVIHIHESYVKIPEDVVFGALPSILTDRRPETFDKGVRPDLAVADLANLIVNAPAKIAEHYEHIQDLIKEHNESAAKDAQIPAAPKDGALEYVYNSNKRTKAERNAGIRTPRKTRTAKDLVFIPFKDENDEIVYDVAISKNGRQMYYKENGDWHRVEKAKKTVLMHNARADNNWLWEWLHKYMAPDQFITHTKWHGAYQIDTMPLTRQVALFGPQGRTKLILPTKYHPKFGEYPSASKDPVVEANTRLENNRLRIPRGMTMPMDESHMDPNEAHVSPAVDCLGELGLYWYEEDIAPEVVNYQKRLSDLDDIVTEIMKPTAAGAPPIISFARFRIPDLTKHMGIVLNTDRTYGDFKRAIGIDLTALKRDPADPMRLLLPDGRNLFDMSKDDWLDLLHREARQRPSNAVIEVFALNKSPMIQPAEAGLKAGANNGLSMSELQKRRDLIFSVPHVRDHLMTAFGEYLPAIQTGPDTHIADPRPEEYRFNAMGDPKRVRIKRRDGDFQAKEAIERAIYERARSKREFYLKRNRYLKLIIRPNPEIEGDTPSPDAYKEFQSEVNKALGMYHRLIKGKRLKSKVQTRKLPLPNKVKFIDNADALDFIWKIRQQALKGHWLVDMATDNYWVMETNTGREIPQSHIGDIEVREFNDNFDVNKGKWDVEFEQLDYSQHFLASIFMMAGKEKLLTKIDPDWKLWYDAKVAFGNHGSPYLDPSQQRLPTNETELYVLEQMKRNAMDVDDAMKGLSTDPDDAVGLYEKFVEGLPGKQRHIAELEKHYEMNIKRNQWTPQKLAFAGYDPVTNMPRENIIYPVASSDFKAAKKFDIPEVAPQRAISDPRFGEMLFPVPATAAMEKMWHRGDLAGEANLVFRSKRTGRHYLAPKAEFKRVVLGKDPSLRHLWEQTKRIFEDSGIKNYDPDKPVYIVSAESMEPLAGTDIVKPVTELQVRGQHRFMATIDPVLAGYRKDSKAKGRPALTGLAIPDYEYNSDRGYDLKRGSDIRLREVEDKTGRETGWEVSTKLTAEPKYWTLAEFEEKFFEGKVDNRFAQNYGFTDARNMYREVSNWFTSIQRPKDSPENRIMLVRFKAVDKKSMTYFDPTEIPRAAVTDNYYNSKREMTSNWGAAPALKL